jgi:uncharacterized protein
MREAPQRDFDVLVLVEFKPDSIAECRQLACHLADEQRGLRFEVDLPDSPLGENVRAAVGRGDIDGASPGSW